MLRFITHPPVGATLLMATMANPVWERKMDRPEWHELKGVLTDFCEVSVIG
jgi:hypothetical protein